MQPLEGYLSVFRKGHGKNATEFSNGSSIKNAAPIDSSELSISKEPQGQASFCEEKSLVRERMK